MYGVVPVLQVFRPGHTDPIDAHDRRKPLHTYVPYGKVRNFTGTTKIAQGSLMLVIPGNNYIPHSICEHISFRFSSFRAVNAWVRTRQIFRVTTPHKFSHIPRTRTSDLWRMFYQPVYSMMSIALSGTNTV